MAIEWNYQIHIDLDDPLADLARKNVAAPALKPLEDVLGKHDARLRNQYDACTDYVADAEKLGTEHFPLYRSTKAMVEDRDKKAIPLRSFFLFIRGQEVYEKSLAEALEADLQPLVAAGVIENLSTVFTNPASNPLPPAHLI